MEPILSSCLKCSAEIPADNSFCGKCGAPVTLSPFDHLIIPPVTAPQSQPAFSTPFVAAMQFLSLFGGAILMLAFVIYFLGGPSESSALASPLTSAQSALSGSEQATKSSNATWHKVLAVTGDGTGTKKTQTFKIKSDKWVIDWTTKPKLFGGTFAIVVKRPGGKWIDLAANAVDEKSGRTVIHHSGDFYLEISGTQAFTVTVRDYY